MMASSTRCSPPQLKHDVFLSFRGEDTRDGFVSHLHEALSKKKIRTFIDDELIRGNEISASLLNAIEGSRISVIIFSEKYASSGWCLDELVKILESKEEYGQFVIPVFYSIDPSHVRHQNGTFAEAFAKHETERAEKVPRWRNALTKAANLSGFDSNVTRPESVLIKEITEVILKKLNGMSEAVNENLVGISSSIKSVERLLHIEKIDVNKVYKVGIWGIGGIGKTTLARAVSDKISKHFEGSYFIKDVKGALKKNGELAHLQHEILSTILEDKYSNINLTSTKERLRRKRILLVIDDVTTCINQTELIENLEGLGLGSRIILTSRDKQVLKNCGVNEVLELRGLLYHDALQLFSQHAFQQKQPKEDFKELSARVVRHAQHVPLALKVLGSFLFGRTKQDWIDALNKLQIIPHEDIQKVLRISYDGLNNEDKNSFLDIACFFRGWHINFVRKFLEACGFYPQVGINVLIERSLIAISFDTIEMHDLIQDMGREIVREESINDPSKRSRLWHHDDIYRVLKNKGTKSIQGILLNMTKIEEINLNPRAFSKMHNLRFFGVYSSCYKEYDRSHGFRSHGHSFRHFNQPRNEGKNKLQGFERLEFDFSELRCLYWHKYPFKSLPPNFQAMNLLELELPKTNIERIWTNAQNLDKLKHINLHHCKHLRSIPDLSKAPNLEELILQGCTSLHETPSILHLNKVVTLNLKGCKSLRRSLTEIHSESLKKVIFSGCSSLKLVPQIPRTVEELHLNGTAIEQLPISIQCASGLKVLNLQYCLQLVSLSSGICQLKSLRSLYLSGCLKLQSLPDDLGWLEGLKVLKASGTAIREVPSSLFGLSCLQELNLKNCIMLENLSIEIGHLKSLELLDLSGCSKLERLPYDFRDLEALEVLKANGTAINGLPPTVPLQILSKLSMPKCKNLSIGSQHISSGLRCLKELYVKDCNIIELPNSLGELLSLEYLDMAGNNFTSIPTTIINLPKLSNLILSNCNMLQSLPELPRFLKYVKADGCTSLQAVSSSSILSLIKQGFYDANLSFINCLKLDWDALIRNILDDAVQNFQQNTTRLLEAFMDGFLRPMGGVCFPGSEIPECFNVQSDGSSIELPQGSINHNFVHFIYCTVLAFQNFRYGSRFKVHFDFSVEREDGTYKSVKGGYSGLYDQDLAIESDHVVVGHNCKLISSYIRKLARNRKVIIRFSIKSSCRTRGSCMVKKCGVRLFGNQDRAKLSTATEGEPCASYFNFISDSEEEEDDSKEEEEEDDSEEEEKYDSDDSKEEEEEEDSEEEEDDDSEKMKKRKMTLRKKRNRTLRKRKSYKTTYGSWKLQNNIWELDLTD